MVGSILGNRVLRTEDRQLLTSGGTYVYDLELDNLAYAFFVRSTVAHATITNLNTAQAAAAPGVIGVITSADLDIAPFSAGIAKVNEAFSRPPLAVDLVRYVGDPIAVVVAESFQQAVDAAELIDIEYDFLPTIVDPESALESESPLIFPEKTDNIAITMLDPESDVLADATHVIRGRYVNQRVAGAPLEPNSAAAIVNGEKLTFYCATQMPHSLKDKLAETLDRDADTIRVIAPDVGGGFGAKAGLYIEFPVLAVLAEKYGRPVTWTETRSEDMVALAHSRAQIQYCETGFDEDGKLTGMRVRLVGDAGAYPSMGALLPGLTKQMANGTYNFPKVRFDVAVAITNTSPTGAYRGAGRPEATALIERAMDQASIELGIDPLEIRRRNFIQSDQFPFDTLTGWTYDTGDYVTSMEKAAEIIDYDDLREQQRQRREQGSNRALGIGVASYVEVTSGGGGSEYASLEIHDDGTATMKAGTSAHGQGHQTSFAMIVSEHTGIPVESITLVQSDTDIVPRGGGTGGSRSLQLGGSAVKEATDAVIAKAKDLTAHLLEASVDDIVVNTEQGTVGVAGVPATALSWGNLAAASKKEVPEGILDSQDGMEGLAAQLDFNQENGTFPFGTHISVVDVDLETGEVTLVRHVAVDDAGTVINPLIFEGQQQGGIGQGISQALYEEVLYDAEGNPQTGNFMDYAFPSAAEMIDFETHHTVTPTHLNPLGAKGIGEAATIGSTPAVQNAVIDALAHLGVRHIDMPCTPERVWKTIQAAEKGTLPDPWREPPEIFDELTAGS
ncbi:MAG: xanthine dehydrogenase family protein molybdopterin-binding subunit [Acidimicrobiales bacterium]|nr:xanthine dehydrogenase family protein molybdopterin-binding subunit [Acidimicrobiales bacterium]